LKAAQSEGYLFADYRLHIIALNEDSLEAEIRFNPGLKILLDTIEVEGTAKLSDQYLQKTLGIQRGEPITPDDLKLLQQQFNNLRFVQQVSPPVLILIDDKATIRAYLNNRNASSFDILAGLQPASGPESKVTLTGYVELDLINQLTRGERIYLHVEKLRPRSQELEMALSYPYLLDLPFGVEGEFRLMKNDTLFSELEWKAGIYLPWGKNQFIRAGVTQQATNIISVDESRIISTKRLPSYVDLRVKGFTMGLSRNRLDFDLNPRKGYSIVVDGSFSQRRVRENDLITGLSEIDTSFDYATLYDSLQDQSTRIAIEAAFQYFIPWGTRSTIRLATDAGILNSGDKLFTNEMFRLGGYARLRGFDEESILAQYYTILSAEYRLLIGGNSYISLFSDYAWIKNVDVDLPLEDHPFGFGFGLNLETGAGIFGMRAAVGAQRGNAIDFGDARLHFGYVNRF
ncbi:MAG TPA: BamA/TamA family outer membrane protein, partial [Saprospiraceae bacterium]|nr:BamA/TamA family outer membrane protein [Saprospiraceae bacterium]